MRQIFFAAILIISLSSVHSEDNSPAKKKGLEDFKAAYQRHLQKIESEHKKHAKKLRDIYGKQLHVIIQKFKDAGNLDNVLAARKEARRFTLEQTVPFPPSNKLPADLQQLQNQHHQAVLNANTEKEKSIWALGEKYTKALDSLMRRLMMEERLTQAVKVKAEREAFETSLIALRKKHQPQPKKKCKKCKGIGVIEISKVITCPSCKGSGLGKTEILVKGKKELRKCLRCKGKETVVVTETVPCNQCKGKGIL